MNYQVLNSTVDDCEAAIVAEFAKGPWMIEACLHTYQSGAIHNALLAAIPGCYWVQLVFDRKNRFLEDIRLQELADAGAEIRIDTFERSLRSQFIVIDYVTSITGSYLYSIPYNSRYSADLQIQDDGGMTSSYNLIWLYHWDHSLPWP